MKSKVIQFFQNLPKEKHEQFNKAFELYRQSEGKNPVMERAVNASGFSENGLENLLYDLQKLHWITDVEKSPLAPEGGIKAEIQKLKVKSENEKWDSLDPDIANLFQSLLAMSIEDRNAWGANRQKQFGDFDELLQLSFSTKLEEVSDCLTKVWEYMSTTISIDENQDLKATEGTRANDSHPGTQINDIDINYNNVANIDGKLGIDFGMLKEQNEDLQDEKFDLEEELEATTEENENLKDELDKLKSLPKIDAKSIRVEFPFLNEKDCPDEFKILVADKITAWNDYLECHKTLLSIESGELVTDDASKAEIAKAAITSFDENQKIYDELVAYAESGKVLGVHPIFKKIQLTREVEEMKADELHNYKGSSAKYFSVNKTALAKAEKAKDTDKIELITTRVVERELKLALVNKKLGINPK